MELQVSVDDDNVLLHLQINENQSLNAADMESRNPNVEWFKQIFPRNRYIAEEIELLEKKKKNKIKSSDLL